MKTITSQCFFMVFRDTTIAEVIWLSFLRVLFAGVLFIVCFDFMHILTRSWLPVVEERLPRNHVKTGVRLKASFGGQRLTGGIRLAGCTDPRRETFEENNMKKLWHA